MSLTDKYRPQAWDEVVGHPAQVKALRNALTKSTNRSFLFTGPSGVGKTTLARLAAREVGCVDLLEIDAATYTGIDEMREVAAGLQYQPLGKDAVKAVIIDEFHALSKAAVQSLLKIIEEPPPWVWWFLCTTEPARVLKTIETRCFRCDLKPVKVDVLYSWLADVADAEEILQSKHGDTVIDLCTTEAQGSPRQALANLALCAAAGSLKEAQELLRSAQESTEAIELARALSAGHSWGDVQKILKGFQDINPESVRHLVRAYATKVAISVKDEAVCGRHIEILDAFSTPFNPADGISPLVLACGKVVLS